MNSGSYFYLIQVFILIIFNLFFFILANFEKFDFEIHPEFTIYKLFFYMTSIFLFGY